jgi:hypothetical protein
MRFSGREYTRQSIRAWTERSRNVKRVTDKAAGGSPADVVVSAYQCSGWLLTSTFGDASDESPSR